MSLSAPTEADIQSIVNLVVAEVSPLRVVLFGSAARGELREHSDVDLMVVVPEGTDQREVAGDLYVCLARAREKVPVNFVVTTPSKFEAHRDTLGLVYREISREGREIYAA